MSLFVENNCDKMYWTEDIETAMNRQKNELERLKRCVDKLCDIADKMEKDKLKTYRFFDHFMYEWVYVRGRNKYEAVRNAFGYEQSRFIFKTFKVKRVYL